METLTRANARRRFDQGQFRLIYLATLPVFLVAALFQRALPLVHAGDHPSGVTILAQAKAAASSCGSFALMG